MEIRIPVIPDYRINAFSGGTISELESGITNGMIEVREGIPYLTQRPSIDIFEDASDGGAGTRGRAIHYWNDATSLYILNAGTLYKGSYATSLSTSPTTGTQRCKFLEFGAVLLLLDAENDQLFTITTGGTVTEVVDVDFPPKDTPAVGIAHGGAILNNVLYVLDEDGDIHGADTGDAAAWTATNFINASRSDDGGAYLGKHHDNLVAFGPSSVEFFYDAGNATGSPLNRRQDVSYNIGCASGTSVWEVGDRMFFVSVTAPGMLSVHTLENFQLTKISNATIDSYLTQSIVKDGFEVVGSGFAAHGHWFYLLTLHKTPTDIDPEITLVYDAVAQKWFEWETTINDQDKFALIDWTVRASNTDRVGEGIFSNGDMFTLNDDMIPLDSLLADIYWVDGYSEIGYVAETSGSGTNIEMKSRTGMVDGGTHLYKFPYSLRFVGDTTPNSQTLTIKWANENSSNFNTGRSQNTSVNATETRLGRFQRRNHEIVYAGSDVIRIESLEMRL